MSESAPLMQALARAASWSMPAGRLAGTVVRLHWSLFLLSGLLLAAGPTMAGVEGLLAALFFLPALFGSVLAHEYGHILVGRRHDVETPSVYLTAIGGLAQMGPFPEDPGTEFRIAVAGPLVSLALAAAAMAPLWLDGSAGLLASSIEGWRLPFVILASINLMLTFFNLIPALPMDGGRILRAALATRMGHTRGSLWGARVGQILGLLMTLVGIANGWTLGMVGTFVLLAASAEWRVASLRLRTEGLPIGRLADPCLPVAALTGGDLPALAVVDVPGGPARVVIDGGGRLVGLVPLSTPLGAYADTDEARRTVSPAPALPASAPASLAWPLLRRTPAVVTDDVGRVVGLISAESVARRDPAS